MDPQTSFSKLWRERFPEISPPQLFFADDKTMAVNNNIDPDQSSGEQTNLNTDRVTESINRDAHESLLACENRIEDLEQKLIRETFVRDYLRNFLFNRQTDLRHGKEGRVMEPATTTTALNQPLYNGISHSCVNFPDPIEVRVGEVCSRVVKGKRSRVSPFTNNGKHMLNGEVADREIPPPLPVRTSSRAQDIDTDRPTQQWPAKNNNSIQHCESIHSPATGVKCDSEQVYYVDSESQALDHSDISNTLDKSTSTELNAELLAHSSGSGKTNFRPVPLPRPKRQPPRLAGIYSRSADGELNSEYKHVHPAQNSTEIPSSGTGENTSLPKSENSGGARRGKLERVQSAGQTTQVKNTPDIHRPLSGEIKKLSGENNVFMKDLYPGKVSSHTNLSKKRDLMKNGLPGVESGTNFTAPVLKTFLPERKGTTSSESGEGGEHSNVTQIEKMLRKLGHKQQGITDDSVTGIKYQPRNAYETVEFVSGKPHLVADSMESQVNSDLSGANEPEDHYDNGMSSVPDLDLNDDYNREPLYETLVIGKSFHAALTTEDESFDSLSLNSSDNETARSDGDLSVDSGVYSKHSVDSHQPSSPDINTGVNHKDPYAALYATVSKLKHENDDGNEMLNIEPPLVAEKPAQHSDKFDDTLGKNTSHEYVEPNAFCNLIYEEPSSVSGDIYLSSSARRTHDYEACIPPGLDFPDVPARDYVKFPPPDEPPELPVRMRRDVQDGGKRPNSQSNRNSSPVSHDIDQFSTDSSDGECQNVTSPEREKERLRHLVVCGILETEKEYLACLELLYQYMKSLEAASASSKPVLCLEDIKVIFFLIPEMYNIHVKFVNDLADRVNQWSPLQTVGDLFSTLIENFSVYGDYMKNYSKAVETITRCCENEQFKQIAESVFVPNSKEKEKTNLQNMLFKPVMRIQRNTLVLHDLLNCTAKSHADYNHLNKALSLSQVKLEEFEDPSHNTSNRKIEQEQHLVKNSFMVELCNGQRKLRYIFLFSDVIVCTKQKISARSQRQGFEVKWFAPLTDIILTDHRLDQTAADSNRASRIAHIEEVEELKKRVSVLKTELRHEMRKEKENENKEKSWSFAARSATKAIEKMKKKLHEQEAALVQASPNLPFKMYHKSSGKSYVFLMSTDYEREEWSEAIKANQTKFKSDLIKKPPTPYDIQNLIENVKQLPKVNSVGNVLLRNCEDDGLNGILNVTVHRLSGLSKPSDTFCCLELDSYGHFYMTARTNICRGEENPVWDEEFEIDLDGSETLRLLCYRRGSESEGDVLLGKSALELKTCLLNGGFKENVISLNKFSLVVSIRHVKVSCTMKRLPSRLKTGVFGVKITTLAKREGRKMPSIITACLEEIEKRGMDETGIYRVSGVTSDVQRLKKAFDKNSRGAVNLLSEFDIHAVSGALKLYFRELPEPLFTEALYGNFINSLGLTDVEAKEKCMLSLLHHLPDPSLRTVLYLIEHLIRVAKHQDTNRMNLNNLATIFGPTLLRPAAKDTGAPTPDMLFLGAQEALSQTAVLYYFIKLREEGKDLSKPKTPGSRS